MNQPGPIQQGPPQLGPPQLGPAHPGPIQPGPAQQVAPGPDNSNVRQITAPPEDDLPPLIQPIPPVAKPNPSASMPSEDTSNQMVPGTVTVPSTSEETPVDGAASVRPPNEGVAPTTDASITAEAAEPGSVAAVSATTAAVTDKPVGEQAAPPPAEPMDEDNLSEISDDPDDILTREEVSGIYYRFYRISTVFFFNSDVHFVYDWFCSNNNETRILEQWRPKKRTSRFASLMLNHIKECNLM